MFLYSIASVKKHCLNLEKAERDLLLDLPAEDTTDSRPGASTDTIDNPEQGEDLEVEEERQISRIGGSEALVDSARSSAILAAILSFLLSARSYFNISVTCLSRERATCSDAQALYCALYST
jgi:hypothetical protein